MDSYFSLRIGGKNLLFALGLICFLVMAGLGWNKLYYGFNFIDEGMYMADGWRLAAGDSLFSDSPTSVTMMYSVLNAGIFSVVPDITLLAFRQLQYVLSLASVAVLSLAIYRWSHEYWYLPTVASIFAFTGLDTLGMSANLSYYTYPHLFLTLHIATLLLALTSQAAASRNFLFVLAGVFLWGLGFSLLPLSVSAVSPLFTWLLMRRLKTGTLIFSGRDALLVTAPVAVLWIGVLSAYNVQFIAAMTDSYRYMMEGGSTGLQINYLALNYIIITAALLALTLIGAKQTVAPRVLVMAALCAVSAYVIETNFFELVPLFWRGWFAAQMWFSAFIIIFLSAFFASRLFGARKRRITDRRVGLLYIILVPSAVVAILFSNYSGMGILAASFVAIPVMLGFGVLLVGSLEGRKVHASVQISILFAFLFPFYYAIAWADWKFTYFDVPPDQLTHVLEDGFGVGIKTNAAFFAIDDWMRTRAEEYSELDDFAVVFDQTSMGYMLIKRRPALNHSYVGWSGSQAMRKEAVEIMIREKREPKIAFRFIRPPLFYPISLKEGTWASPGLWKYRKDDPISLYVSENMDMIDTAVISGTTFVEFYVRPGDQVPAMHPRPH